ncbi:MAG: GNAT family N-acetyltransferase [Candidatus Bathyarchaeia archaeon]
MDSKPVRHEPLKKILDSFWSKELGFSIRDLRKGDVKIIGVDHQIEIPPYCTLLAMKVYGGCVVAVQQGSVSEAEEALQNHTAEGVFTEEGIEVIQGLFSVSADRMTHWLHLYCDSGSVKPYRKHRARRLMPYGSDRRMCEEWTSKYPRAVGPYSYEAANPVSYGIVLDGELASLAVVWRYGLPFWEIGVETRPDCRGRGYAKSVVSLATEEVLAADKSAWYYLDVNPTNEASLKVAKSVGYVEYSETLNQKIS